MVLLLGQFNIGLLRASLFFAVILSGSRRILILASYYITQDPSATAQDDRIGFQSYKYLTRYWFNND